MQSYPPLRPVEPRPPILPAHSISSPDNYRLPSSVSPAQSLSLSTPGVPTHLSPSINNNNNNAEAGPSMSAPTAAAGKKRIGVANAKKRRAPASAPDDASTEDGISPPISRPPTKQRDGPKKKKAQRACAHCQKAHLTCDDSRPCQRCVKRGMADKCVEGHRKKAKYLLDEAELEALKKGKTISQSSPEGSQPPPSTQPVMDQFPGNDLYFNLPIDQQYGFTSEAANLEYSSLSAILGMNNYSPEQPFLTSETPPASASVAYGSQFANAAWPAEPSPPNIAPQALMGGQSVGYDGAYVPQSQQQQSQQQQQNGSQYIQDGRYAGQNLFDNTGASNISIQQNGREQQQLTVQSIPADAAPYSAASELSFASQQSYMQPSASVVSSLQQQQQQQHQQQAQRLSQSQSQLQSAANAASPMVQRSSTMSTTLSPPASDSPPTSVSATEPGSGTAPGLRPGETPSDVYSTVTKPYSYIESYQFLMSFLYKRFHKNDILRVIRALAIYRPSLIALQAPMTEEDFVFMEKCLRRSLLELEKLISYSGTPTVVWRRTGEICLVGVEFCLLTDWKKEDLLTGRKYIYELFESQSVIEYWEKFASHAFENTSTSVVSHCVLLKPSGEPIPCTFCFSIRRDIFDLPSLVIGQWLPLL